MREVLQNESTRAKRKNAEIQRIYYGPMRVHCESKNKEP